MTHNSLRDNVRVPFLALLFLGLSVPAVHAQYRDYPQTAGKVQPLNVQHLPNWLSFDAEARERGEGQSSVNYSAGNENGYDLSRLRGGFTVQPKPWLDTYIQFQDAHALDLPPIYTASNMHDNFDFRQAYLEFKIPHADIKAGRQELRFGGERLVGVSDWTNVSRTFDAVSGKFGGSIDNVTLFTSSVVVIHPTSLDEHAAGLNFHGAYGSLCHLLPRTSFEPYVFIKALPYVSSQQSKPGTETEVAPGMRVMSNLPKHFEYTAEGVLERGSYSNDSIHAGAGYIKAGYTAPIPWSPRILAEYDYATGNPHTNANRVSTFDQLYPSSHNAFGLVDLFGWQNIKEERIDVDLNPAKHLTFLLQAESLQVANIHDAVYSGSGGTVIKRVTTGFKSDDLGTGIDISSKYVYHDYLVLNSGFTHFYPGAVMTQNAHKAPQTIAYAGLTYRFRISNPKSD